MDSRGARVVILVLLFIGVVAYLAIDIFDMARPVSSGDTENIRLIKANILKEFDSQAMAQVYSSDSDNGGYFFITKDGIKYFGYDGKEMQSGSFNMTSPIIAKCENVVGVWEFRGNDVYIFSDNGELHSHKTDVPVLNVSVNAIGYCSFITQEQSGYRLYVYDNKGTKVKEGVFNASNVFPVSSCISNDGEMLAVGFLDTSGVRMNSLVAYSSLNSSESIQYTDTVFASSVTNIDEIIISLKFISADSLIIVTDKKIKCVKMSDPSKDDWSIDLNNELDNICFNGEDGFAVALGQGILNKPSEEPGIVKYYNSKKGELIWEYRQKNKVTLLNSGYGAIIIGCKGNFTAFNVKGSKLWEFGSAENIINIFFFQNADNIIKVTENDVSVYSVYRNVGSASLSRPYKMAAIAGSMYHYKVFAYWSSFKFSTFYMGELRSPV